MVKERKCPLNCKEWVQFLATETTLKRHDYYYEDLSLLTKLIVVLTIINGFIVFVSIINSFKSVPEYTVLILTIVALFLYLYIILFLKKILKSLDA